MKKIVLIPLIVLFALTISAQEKFSLPELNDNQKQWRLVSQLNGMMLNQINYAKSIGKSVEDVATFAGNQFKLSWNKENGWEGYVKGCLGNWTIIRPDNKLDILEQSDTMIRFKSKIPYARLKNNGPRYNVSHEEYMSFLKIAHKIIGEYLGASTTFEDVDDGIINEGLFKK